MGRNQGSKHGWWAIAAFTLMFGVLTVCLPQTAQALPKSEPQASQSDPCVIAPSDAQKLRNNQIEWDSRLCKRGSPDLDAPQTMVYVPLVADQSPRFVISRAAKFVSMRVGVQTDEGISWGEHDFDEIHATYFDRQFFVPLPAYRGEAKAVLVEVERPTQATTFDHLKLASDLPGSSRTDVALLLLVAIITGMMMMPILFDLVAFRILRERFILWHSAFVVSLVMQLICSFGLYAAVADVTLPWVRVLTIGSFSFMVLAGIIFTTRFIEVDKRPPRMTRWLGWLTAIFTAVSIVHMAGIEALGRWPSVTYFSAGGILAIAVMAFLVMAFRNDSKAVRFLIVGLSPLMAVAVIRVISFLLPGIPVVDANGLLLAVTIIEVVATGLGVASRFLDIKQERDSIHAERDRLKDVANKDALTGLLNRRAFDQQFADLRRSGFDTFALLDLDRFKDINDRFGHQVGDAVLRACAGVLSSADAEKCVSMRLGGEEFVLLLKGAGAKQRAEAMRQAIPRRIASDVPELDRLVTASMGLVNVPYQLSGRMDFEQIYAHADRLLYEAKSAGRNRMLYERLQVFGDRKRPKLRASA